jgi:hypothetical protein
LFLSYTLKDPLGSRTLHARVFGFEYFAESFCCLQRGVEGNLSFFRAAATRSGVTALGSGVADLSGTTKVQPPIPRRFEHFAPRG